MKSKQEIKKQQRKLRQRVRKSVYKRGTEHRTDNCVYWLPEANPNGKDARCVYARQHGGGDLRPCLNALSCTDFSCKYTEEDLHEKYLNMITDQANLAQNFRDLMIINWVLGASHGVDLELLVGTEDTVTPDSFDIDASLKEYPSHLATLAFSDPPTPSEFSSDVVQELFASLGQIAQEMNAKYTNLAAEVSEGFAKLEGVDGDTFREYSKELSDVHTAFQFTDNMVRKKLTEALNTMEDVATAEKDLYASFARATDHMIDVEKTVQNSLQCVGELDTALHTVKSSTEAHLDRHSKDMLDLIKSVECLRSAVVEESERVQGVEKELVRRLESLESSMPTSWRVKLGLVKT